MNLNGKRIGMESITLLVSCQSNTKLLGLIFRLYSQTVAAMDGILIRASKSIKIPPHYQRLIEIDLNFKLPEGTFGELCSTADVSQIEPIAAPGLLQM